MPGTRVLTTVAIQPLLNSIRQMLLTSIAPNNSSRTQTTCQVYTIGLADKSTTMTMATGTWRNSRVKRGWSLRTTRKHRMIWSTTMMQWLYRKITKHFGALNQVAANQEKDYQIHHPNLIWQWIPSSEILAGSISHNLVCGRNLQRSMEVNQSTMSITPKSSTCQSSQWHLIW